MQVCSIDSRFYVLFSWSHVVKSFFHHLKLISTAVVRPSSNLPCLCFFFSTGAQLDPWSKWKTLKQHLSTLHSALWCSFGSHLTYICPRACRACVGPRRAAGAPRRGGISCPRASSVNRRSQPEGTRGRPREPASEARWVVYLSASVIPILTFSQGMFA